MFHLVYVDHVNVFGFVSLDEVQTHALELVLADVRKEQLELLVLRGRHLGASLRAWAHVFHHCEGGEWMDG